jgi:hypothetical protein
MGKYQTERYKARKVPEEERVPRRMRIREYQNLHDACTEEFLQGMRRNVRRETDMYQCFATERSDLCARFIRVAMED